MTRVLIDVGHWIGEFPPSKGVNRNGKGYAEYDFNIKLARSIARILEANGVDVTVYPNDGRNVGLKNRTDYYNRENFDLVVSIHANANDNPNVNGRCVFYWHNSSNSKRLAELVRDEIQAKGYSTHGNGLHASMVGSWTNLHIVRETRMPSVLIEHGFMTGNQDFELIFGSKQDKYIKDMAEANANAILRYFGMPYKAEVKKVEEDRKVEVVMSGDLYRVQVGAFSNKENAERLAKELKDKGYPVYIPDSQEVTVKEAPKPASKPKPQKSIDQLAQEVIDNKHGTGDERRRSLGSQFDAVQARVNELLRPTPKRSVKDMADEIERLNIRGNDARAKHLGLSLKEYEPVRKELNRRYK